MRLLDTIHTCLTCRHPPPPPCSLPLTWLAGWRRPWSCAPPAGGAACGRRSGPGRRLRLPAPRRRPRSLLPQQRVPRHVSRLIAYAPLSACAMIAALDLTCLAPHLWCAVLIAAHALWHFLTACALVAWGAAFRYARAQQASSESASAAAACSQSGSKVQQV
jgi:hypothetical protein